MAPGVLSSWGHAGPDTTLGWLSLLFNFPGMLLAALLSGFTLFDGPTILSVAVVFALQTLIISYLVFVYLRWGA